MKIYNVAHNSILTYRIHVNLNKEPTLYQLEKLITNADALDFQTSFLISDNMSLIELNLKLSPNGERSNYV